MLLLLLLFFFFFFFFTVPVIQSRSTSAYIDSLAFNKNQILKKKKRQFKNSKSLLWPSASLYRRTYAGATYIILTVFEVVEADKVCVIYTRVLSADRDL